jgi:hypothetical protein
MTDREAGTEIMMRLPGTILRTRKSFIEPSKIFISSRIKIEKPVTYGHYHRFVVKHVFMRRNNNTSGLLM